MVESAGTAVNGSQSSTSGTRPRFVDIVKRVSKLSSLRAVGSLLLVAAAFWALSFGEGTSPSAETKQWFVWKVVTSLSIAVAVLLGSSGLRLLNDPKRTPATGRSHLFDLAIALILVIALFSFQAFGTDLEREWNIPQMQVRLFVVTLATGLASVPWLALLWLVQRAAASWEYSRGAPIGLLIKLWELLTACVVAFSTLVVIALLPTGALRLAWNAQAPKRDPATAGTFEQSEVLLYGAFFAVLLTILTLPALLAWRNAARRVVNTEYGLEKAADVTETWSEGRSRLENALHLDVSVIRTPLTAFTVFTPLITSAVAAFIPELGT